MSQQVSEQNNIVSSNEKDITKKADEIFEKDKAIQEICVFYSQLNKRYVIKTNMNELNSWKFF